MKSDLAFSVFRVGYLALLWLMVLAAVSTLRRDIFGTVVTPRGKGRRTADKRRKKSQKARKDRASDELIPRSLLITGGPLVGMTLTLGSAQITIGRSPNCIMVLEDEYVSGQHAMLSPQDGEWVIEDLGSRNGTFVDDERITQPTVVHPGTTIRIGQTTLELVR